MKEKSLPVFQLSFRKSTGQGRDSKKVRVRFENNRFMLLRGEDFPTDPRNQ